MSIGNRVFMKRPMPEQGLLDEFSRIPAANIADTMGRSCAMNPRIKLMSGADKIMVGPALTVKTRAGDNLFIHQALDMALPGDIIVVSNDEDDTRALMGEVMFTYAQYQRKLGGLVLDGPVRDTDALSKMPLPVYATGSTPGGPHKEGPGEINIPIACGGISVNPGDIIVADMDGIIVIPLKDAPAVLEAAKMFSAQDQKKVEDTKLPGFLSIFNDNVVSTALLMTIFLGTIMAIIGRETLMENDTTFTANTLMLTYIVTTCFHFSVYMYILLAGVRMFVSELMKAFDGISKKIVKGAMPAVDCAVSYNFAHPNVPLFGFVFGFLGQLVAILGLLVFKSPLFLVPGFVPLFFDNATVAVYANSKGGRRAAMIVPFLNGIFQVLISLIMILFIQAASGTLLTAWPAFFDNSTFFALFTVAVKYINPYVATIAAVLILLGITQIHYRHNKEHYYDHIKQ